MSELPLNALFFRDWKNAHIPEIMEEIWLRNIYQPFLTGKRDLTVVDIGQNVGIFSYYASPYAKRVIGLEPSTMHQDTLKTMIEYNKLTNVETLPYGISNVNDKKTFHLTANNTAFSLTNFDPNAPTEEIEVITIKKLFDLAKIDHIDVLKLDCEGEESKVVTSDEFKEYAPKIKVIVFEFHDWTEMSQIQFQHALEEAGYMVTWNRDTKAKVGSAVRI